MLSGVNSGADEAGAGRTLLSGVNSGADEAGAGRTLLSGVNGGADEAGAGRTLLSAVNDGADEAGAGRTSLSGVNTFGGASFLISCLCMDSHGGSVVFGDGSSGGIGDGCAGVNEAAQ